ncbi:hypothetical protein KY362_00255 [Candidatus Woesearchaeota archaeon]|nr:hypothetical protein [Candidatus Woesearchaeota archaeon]
MAIEREHLIALFLCAVAILVIVGGYASFSGLATAAQPLQIEMVQKTFSKSDVFDVNVIVNPVTLLADESLMIYLDNEAVGVIALKQYLDTNGIEYGTEIKNLGQNSAEIINLKSSTRISLADHISTEFMYPGTTHILRVELSQGEAVAEDAFGVE